LEALVAALGLGPALELLALEPPGLGGTLLTGLRNSLVIAVGAYALGLAIGLIGVTGKLYGGPVTRDLLAAYTTVVRAVPELVLILILFYAGQDAINRALAALGQPRVEISGVVAGIAVFGIVQGAYATEVIRGAIQAVPFGQIETARAFCMTGPQVLRRITLPAMLPNAIPGLANLWLIATKDTALLAIVGFNELTLATRQAAASMRAYFTFFLAAGALYLAITLLSGVSIGRIERRARRGQPGAARG
jgi:polar amino acid transport system permease protein